MLWSRREFLQTGSALGAAFLGLRTASLVHAAPSRKPGYGPLKPDPQKIIDLPAGFSYRIISRTGDEMDDGLLTPASPDGMATFAGPDGLTIIIRNHELLPNTASAFGRKNERLSKIPREKLYDYGQGRTPSAGGTTTVVYDTREQKIVRQFLSLAGTMRNCAGGPTPWNSWVTCEETVFLAGEHAKEEFVAEQDHGYNFEVPATAEPSLAEPLPLIDMGRFNHEAIAVHPETGIVYETEDRDDGLFYRFVPRTPGKLIEGGKLQALAIVGSPSIDTRNWSGKPAIQPGATVEVEWIDMENVTAPRDDLRQRGFEAGAAKFARGEGIYRGDGEFFFACTSGGAKKLGQIWRYIPSPHEGTPDEANRRGKLELFVESTSPDLIENCDNLTMAPWGDLIVCEDRSAPCRLIGCTPQGELYAFSQNHLNTELAGCTFSPDGSTLFVNLQKAGMTLAITGPWKS